MIDIALISAAATSIKAAKEIATAALSVRDFALVATEIGRMNDQLLKAQDALFAHNAQLLSLQQQLFETSEQLRKAKETIAERGRYSLVEVASRKWAYRVNPVPSQGTTGESVTSQSAHYLCQACFDNGRKVVLQYFEGMTGGTLDCSVCDASLYVGKTFS